MSRQKGQTKSEYIPTADILALADKLRADPTGGTLTRTEKNREIVKEEVAVLLSVLAGRTISHRYVKELAREDKGSRLRPSRIVSTTFFYRVGDLLHVTFNRMTEKSSEK